MLKNIILSQKWRLCFNIRYDERREECEILIRVLTAHNRQDYEGQKGKSINDMSIIDEIWVIQRSTKSRYFINDWYKI